MCRVFKSPSAFSVYVKRKINPGRKADDGWTSVKYLGEVLSSYRSKLDVCLTNVEPAPDVDGTASPLHPLNIPRQKRRPRSKPAATEWSEEDGASDLPSTEASDPEREADADLDATGPGACHVPDLDYTWIQCENPGCCKWRRVRYSQVLKMSSFRCSDNTSDRR